MSKAPPVTMRQLRQIYFCPFRTYFSSYNNIGDENDNNENNKNDDNPFFYAFTLRTVSSPATLKHTHKKKNNNDKKTKRPRYCKGLDSPFNRL